eukprot:TRINITY_DN8898_c0_g1_i1.p1 TRINITY_DN8898_c0_g1~~TRINITY_DN8898_c0_g1_i1.p1  ORF type:complete len:272 (+),score=102.07 TRINITY_DN8898_c0_g1_i1:55-870(+)
MSEDKAAFCENCVSGHLHSGTPSGTVGKLGDLDCYFAIPSDGSKKKSILFITDIFGWEVPNARLLADEYAKNGFYVYLPDLLKGDSLPIELLKKIAPSEADPPREGIITAIADKTEVTARLGAWMIKHRDAVTKPLIEYAIHNIRANSDGKIGAVGFCWGGRHAAILAANGTGIDASVACHPSGLVVPDELAEVTKPLAFAAGDIDDMFNAEAAQKTREVLEKKGVVHEVKIYPKQVHGFAVRGDLSQREIKEGKEAATHQTINWFKTHLA